MRTLLLAFLIAAVAMGEQPLPALRISMISLGVKDMERSVRFYSETLGLQVQGKPSEVTLLRAGDVTLALNIPLGQFAGEHLVGAVEVIFPVESVAAAHKSLVGRGCKFLYEPHEVTTNLWAATFTDPDGHKLTIIGSQ